MDSYSDSSFWDNAHLPDNDFFALLHKQFPPTVDTNLPLAAVDPQTLSSYSLPSLTPPSDDSSPSPPNSNQDAPNDDLNEPPLKRKASDEDLSDTPNQKNQHTGQYYRTLQYPISLKFSSALHSDKKNSPNPARRKSAGHAVSNSPSLLSTPLTPQQSISSPRTRPVF